MKLLLFTDTHGHDEYLAKVKEQAKQADVIICAGDFTQFEHKIEKVLYAINSMGKQVLLIHGNHEDEESIEQLTKRLPYVIFLHERLFKKGDITFWGYGGGGFSTTDREFIEVATAHFEKHKGRNVLILHGPPYGVACDALHEGHVGNKSYTEIIKKYQPELVICGHLHECFGREDKIGKSRIINPGPMGRFVDV